MVTVEEAETDYAEVGEHVLTSVDGHIRFDKIWRCERCGAERTHLTHYDGIECDGDSQ